jgi:sulfofructose kinase
MPTDDEPFDVVCYGTISVDNITHLPYLPTPRRDSTAIAEYDEVGGEALKVAIPLATWGLHVLVVGNVIGTDRKADFILNELARYPTLDTRHIRQYPNTVTPFSRILVTPDGDRSRIAYHYDVTPKVELTLSMMRQGRALSVDAYGLDERDRAAGVARELGKPVIAADAIWPQYPLAGLSDVVIISSVWLQTNFPGVYEYDHALELQAIGAGVIAITDGARPVLVVRADGSAFGIEPYHIERVIDTSGAGNLFKAGMIYGWLQPDWSLEQKVKFACAAAGLYCQRERGTDPPLSLDEIATLMREQPR